MNLHEKYCNTKDKDKPENKDKIVLPDESYALLEVLNDLAFKIGRIKK